jgi:membrane protease YdiL (CAAX protease family)
MGFTDWLPEQVTTMFPKMLKPPEKLTFMPYWFNFFKNTLYPMKKMLPLLWMAALPATILLPGCGGSPGQSPAKQYIIDVTGTAAVFNCSKSYTYACHYALEEEDTVGLALTAVGISFSVQRISSLPAVFGLVPVTRKVTGYGMILGILYNFIKTDYLFPASFTRFALIAPLIGAAEEMVFRGFVQTTSAVSMGAVASVLMGASGHTLYKFFVIWTLPADMDICFPSLLILTFLSGLIFGFMKQGSGSILPAVLAHASFDIIVYGGSTLAPIWVWG